MSCLLGIQLAVKCWVGKLSVVEMVYSTAGFSLSLYPTMKKKNDMFHENNACVKDQLISCSPAL